MENQNEIELVIQELAEILRYRNKNLIDPGTWGDINYPDACKEIERIFPILSDLYELPIQLLPEKSISTILPPIGIIKNSLNIIESRSLSVNMDSQRKTLRNDVHNAVEILCQEVCAYIPYLAYRHGNENKGIAVLKKAKSEAESSLLAIEKKKEEIDVIISTAKSVVADLTVQEFTHEFDSEAETLKSRSMKWLISTVIFALLTIVSAVYYWPSISTTSDAWALLRDVISKSAVIAVLFTGTVWCGRIYRALMHQSTTNRHRALSLKTFQAFIAAANDDRVKDSVLMAAARTIFGHASTGLVSENGTERESEVNYVEIGRPPSE